MALTFSTIRQRKLPAQGDLANRLAAPRATGDVLGDKGVRAARAFAQKDVTAAVLWRFQMRCATGSVYINNPSTD